MPVVPSGVQTCAEPVKFVPTKGRLEQMSSLKTTNGAPWSQSTTLAGSCSHGVIVAVKVAGFVLRLAMVVLVLAGLYLLLGPMLGLPALF